MYWTYVIQSKTTGKIYIGQTDNLIKRLKQHSDPESRIGKYTKLNQGPWELVYKEEFETREEAVRREKELKSFRGREYIRSRIKGR